MRKYIKTIVLGLLILTAGITAHAQQSPEKWFAAKAYLNGLKLAPAESNNKAEFAKQYAANKEVWDKVFAYLKNTDLEKLPVGKYPIEGTNLFAAVTDNPTKDYDQTAWESHRKFIDLQYVSVGAEKMAVMPVAGAKVTAEYDDKKDVAHYDGEGKLYVAAPGTFYLFFPVDAHRVNIKADGADHDKKIVIKINYVE